MPEPPAEPVPPFRPSWRVRLSGYDYFVAYHWASGGAYAVALTLAQQLRTGGYDVFLDRAGYALGDDGPEVGERALRRTRRLVLVATPEAVTRSEPVAREGRLFTARSGQVIPGVFTAPAEGRAVRLSSRPAGLRLEGSFGA